MNRFGNDRVMISGSIVNGCSAALGTIIPIYVALEASSKIGELSLRNQILISTGGEVHLQGLAPLKQQPQTSKQQLQNRMSLQTELAFHVRRCGPLASRVCRIFIFHVIA